jgi:PPOX class probable F420-dependent enzyme
MYSRPGAHRIENIRRQPRVSLHFDSDGGDGDVVIINGRAQVDLEAPPADAVPGFIAKYERRMVNIPPATWAATFSIPIRIRVESLRGWGPPQS